MLSLKRSVSSSCSVCTSRRGPRSSSNSAHKKRSASARHSSTLQNHHTFAHLLALPSRIPKPSPLKSYDFVHAHVFRWGITTGYTDNRYSALPLPVRLIGKRYAKRVEDSVIEVEGAKNAPVSISNQSQAASANMHLRSQIPRPCNPGSCLIPGAKYTPSRAARAAKLALQTHSSTGSGVSLKVGNRVLAAAVGFASVSKDFRLTKVQSMVKLVQHAPKSPVSEKQRTTRVAMATRVYERHEVAPCDVQTHQPVTCVATEPISVSKDVRLAKGQLMIKTAESTAEASTAEKQQPGRVAVAAQGYKRPEIATCAVGSPEHVACARNVLISTSNVSKTDKDSMQSNQTALRTASLNGEISFNI